MQLSRAVGTDAMRPRDPQMFTIWTFTERAEPSPDDRQFTLVQSNYVVNLRAMGEFKSVLFMGVLPFLSR